MNYYNEFDPKAAAWLRELIKANLIAPGEVDERSITEVSAHELRGYQQCHFFAGIGGWSYALRLAGVPDDVPIWTGSCPCQPFSDGGLGLGEADPRHLWPVFYKLIEECGPSIIIGEQVASKSALRWLDGVFADLERSNYACAAADLCAASVGAPHIRQRLWWMAHTNFQRFSGEHSLLWETAAGRNEKNVFENAGSSETGGLGNPHNEGQQRRIECGHSRDERTPWASSVALPCTDGKSRRIESGTFPLAHGIPDRVGRLRGYGNAIVPQVAAEFIKAAFESIGDCDDGRPDVLDTY